MTVEIGMPVYRPSGRLEAVLTALALQTYKDFFVTIYNNTDVSDIEEIKKDEQIIKSISEKYGIKINLIQNPKNLGYMKNMHQIFEKATGDFLFLLADDDIVSNDWIELGMKAFEKPDVGCIARPYYWFTDNMKKAVRFEGKIRTEIQYVKITNSTENAVMIHDCLMSAAQLSGLGFRRAYLLGMPFEEDMFTAHVYPFLHIFSKHICAYMPKPTVAVSINTSQCHTDIYDPSPMEQWLKIYDKILPLNECEKINLELKKIRLTDFYGLAQIKNYGTYKELFYEIAVHIKNYKLNLLNPKFYLFAAGSIILPRKFLIKMVDFYKNKILSKKLAKMDINYKDFPFDVVEPIWVYPTTNERKR